MERGVIRADPVVLLKCSSKSFAVVPIESSNCRILRQSSAVIMPIMAAAWYYYYSIPYVPTYLLDT